MAQKTWTLLDGQHNLFGGDGVVIDASDVGGSQQGYVIKAWTEHAGLSQGVQRVSIDNGTLTVDVLPTRGMSLWRAAYAGANGEEFLGWKSPVRGPVHPAYVPLSEASGLGWLDGFDELLVRCGLESNGAPDFDASGQLKYSLHGRIGNRPAHFVQLSVDGDTGEITLVGEVEECRFHFLKLRLRSTIRTRLNSNILEITDEVINLSASRAEIQLLYHVNFGSPLLDAGAQVVAAPQRVVPRNDHAAEGIASWHHFGAETAGFAEQVYFLELFADEQHKTRTLLKNAHGTRGASLVYDTRQLPYFSLWKNTTAVEDGCVTGLEPGTNFPNPRSFEGTHGRTVPLKGRASARFELTLAYHPDEESVTEAEQAIRRLQTSPPQVANRPDANWCA